MDGKNRFTPLPRFLFPAGSCTANLSCLPKAKNSVLSSFQLCGNAIVFKHHVYTSGVSWFYQLDAVWPSGDVYTFVPDVREIFNEFKRNSLDVSDCGLSVLPSASGKGPCSAEKIMHVPDLAKGDGEIRCSMTPGVFAVKVSGLRKMWTMVRGGVLLHVVEEPDLACTVVSRFLLPDLQNLSQLRFPLVQETDFRLKPLPSIVSCDVLFVPNSLGLWRLHVDGSKTLSKWPAGIAQWSGQTCHSAFESIYLLCENSEVVVYMSKMNSLQLIRWFGASPVPSEVKLAIDQNCKSNKMPLLAVNQLCQKCYVLPCMLLNASRVTVYIYSFVADVCEPVHLDMSSTPSSLSPWLLFTVSWNGEEILCYREGSYPELCYFSLPRTDLSLAHAARLQVLQSHHSLELQANYLIPRIVKECLGVLPALC